jgi:poly(3-hydroxybutyrate) depolymerase
LARCISSRCEHCRDFHSRSLNDQITMPRLAERLLLLPRLVNSGKQIMRLLARFTQIVLGAAVAMTAVLTAFAQNQPSNATSITEPSCKLITQASADASAGVPNINHDGTPLPGQAAPDISRGFAGIPRSAQPKLTASQARILECSYSLSEANAEMPYTLFVPSTYDPKKATPLIVDLHGLNITPLQQILFDGTTDFAERYGFIVVAPMGYSVSGGWGGRVGTPVETAQVKPGGEIRYSASELSEIDAMTVLKMIRQKYTIDPNRIYLMGHSMGGGGTYYLGGKYNDIWAALAPIAGAGGIANAGAAEKYKGTPMLIMHGAKDSIVPPATSRRAVMALQAVGAQHVYLEFPEKDHEFWIRRGAENMEKVFLFFSTVSKWTTLGPITPEMAPPPPPRGTLPGAAPAAARPGS